MKKNLMNSGKKTEVIREYHKVLYTFGDMKLPYIFLAEHNTYSDRIIVCRGVVHIAKPSILLPGGHQGPHFAAGFENADYAGQCCLFNAFDGTALFGDNQQKCR